MENTEVISVEPMANNEPREDLIKTAVKFLQNPQVAKSPLAQSQKFLQKKGLTDQEIKIACERSGAYNNYYNQHYEKPIVPPQLPTHLMTYYPQPTLFYKTRDILQSIAVFSGIGYLIYLFYKKFIRPWLFGRDKKKSVEENLSDLNKTVTNSVKELQDNLTEVKSQVDRISITQSENASTNSQLQELKNEISTVKGLLLNRKQFPSVPSAGAPLVPPSIPAWQLSSVQHDQDGDNKTEDIIEIGSGSGSSETEVVTKNSDSSLEIIFPSKMPAIKSENKISNDKGIVSADKELVSNI